MAALILGVGSCAGKPVIRDALAPPWTADVPVAPLAVESVRASESEGYHAVFLKLSRFADSVSYAVGSDPTEIRLDLGGPAVGEDLAEERFVLADRVVNAVRLSRRGGVVHVVIEVQADEVPYYSVHEMADWIMVRVALR